MAGHAEVTRLLTTGALDVESISATDRATQWESATSAFGFSLAMGAVAPEAPFHREYLRRRWIAELALVDLQCGRSSAARTTSTIADSDQRYMILLMIERGEEVVAQGGTRTALRPGDALLWDSTRAARFDIQRNLRKRLLMIPERVFEPMQAVVPQGDRFVSSPAARLLMSYLDSLWVALPQLSLQATISARNATLELIEGALRPGTDLPVSGTIPALRTSMDRWIDQHLARLHITPTEVAAAHAVSVRTVHRVFAETGETLGSAVRRRHLLRARADLAATDLSISSIAARWQFSDASHFTRSFKLQFGLSPTAYRADARQGEASEGEGF